MSATASLRHHWDVLMASWADETRRRRTERRDQEAHSFLPAALEVLETPPSPIGRVLLWGMLAFIGAAILWACVGKLDVVVSAQGKVIPISRVKVLQSADGGVVRGIHVQDGQRVRAGQLLIELDPTQSGADAAQAAAALETARLDAARAQALLRFAETGVARYRSPPGTPIGVQRTQETLVTSEVAGFEAQRADLIAKRAESAALSGMARQERDKLAATLPLLSERVARRKQLVDKGLSPLLLQLELQQQQLTHERDIGVQAQSAERYASATAAIAMQARAARETFIQEAAALLAKADGEIRLREEELRKATQKSQLQRLTAPVDGTVQQLSLYTLGAVVKPADPILVIVPAGGALIVDTQVRNRDVGQLRVGQPAAIKLEAFSFTRYGTIPGELIGLSKDAVQDEKLGLVYQARVRIRCDEESAAAGDIRQLRAISYLCARIAPGMATTVDVRTGTRRIITFLLSPLQRRLAEAGREE